MNRVRMGLWQIFRLEGAGLEGAGAGLEGACAGARFRVVFAALEEDSFSEPILEKRSVGLMGRLMVESSVNPVSSPTLKRSRHGAGGDDSAASSSVSCGVD